MSTSVQIKIRDISVATGFLIFFEKIWRNIRECLYVICQPRLRYFNKVGLQKHESKDKVYQFINRLHQYWKIVFFNQFMVL